ncbi:ABC transporter substrate-binding protein [Geodermatophilus ruber]|nr:ABC transporter substrate-binding protein [Geodermatophilus ruber]
MSRRRFGRLGAAAVTIVVTALALSGCRGGSEDPTDGGGGGGNAAEGEPITIGGSFPFSGGLALYGGLSQGAQAYFEQVNADGGVNGREIEYTALDDGYDPSRLASNARQFVEQEGVFAVVSFGGTNLAIRDYMKTQGVPHFVMAGNAALSEIESHPHTRAWWPDIRLEGAITAHAILEQNPDAQIGVMGFNNDITVSQIEGLTEGLGDQADQLIAEETYPPSATDLSAQINRLQAAGVDTVVAALGGPVGVSALQYMDQIGWDPDIYNYSNASAIETLTANAGAAADGLHSVQWLKDPADEQWADDEGIQAFQDAVEQYGDGASPNDMLVLNGYAWAQALVAVLESMGDDITQEGLIEAWDNLESTENQATLPDVQMEAGPDGRLIHSYKLTTWDGSTWQIEGDVIDGLELGLLG